MLLETKAPPVFGKGKDWQDISFYIYRAVFSPILPDPRRLSGIERMSEDAES